VHAAVVTIWATPLVCAHATTIDKNQGSEVFAACLHLPAGVPPNKANVAFGRIRGGIEGLYLSPDFDHRCIKADHACLEYILSLERRADQAGVIHHEQDSAVSQERLQAAREASELLDRVHIPTVPALPSLPEMESKGETKIKIGQKMVELEYKVCARHKVPQAPVSGVRGVFYEMHGVPINWFAEVRMAVRPGGAKQIVDMPI